MAVAAVVSPTALLFSYSHALSYILHLLISSAIALEGMVAASNPLGSRRVDAAELSSPFTCGGVRQITQSYYSTVKKLFF